MDEIEGTLRRFIAEKILFSGNGYTHPDETSFLETGVVDSMSVMELVLFAEQTYGIQTSDREITPSNFDSVKSLAEFIRRKQASG